MVIQALSDWNPWWVAKSVPNELCGKERFTTQHLEKLCAYKEIKLLLGVRRSGKSTLFYQLIRKLLEKGVESRRIVLVNFEDPALARMKLEEIFGEYRANVNPDAKPYVFLDEVHNCADWAQFLRKLYDLKKLEQAFITDSSSKFIKPEYAGVLTGRALEMRVFPLSFLEEISWKGIEYGKLSGKEEEGRVRNALLEYTRWGGFPEAFLRGEAGRRILLAEYFGDIIRKDIVERYNVDYHKIRPLADFLLESAACKFSPRKYLREFGLSLESISTYLQMLCEVQMFFTIPKFSYSLKARQLSQKKIYVCDLGFFSSVASRFSPDFGRAYENAAYLHLNGQGKEICYFEGKNQCDFLLKEGTKIVGAIQVCAQLKPANKEREVGGLCEAMEEFGLKEGLVVTQNTEREERINGRKVRFVPLWKWLLQPEG